MRTPTGRGLAEAWVAARARRPRAGSGASRAWLGVAPSARRLGLAGVTLGLTALLTAPVSADVIYLRNGGAITVEAWRDLGDEVEFTFGGGFVRLPKTDIERIVGPPARGPLMPQEAPVPADPVAAVAEMRDILADAMQLHWAPAVPPEKAQRYRVLNGRWRRVDVPEELRPVHARGQRALQFYVDLFTGAPEGPGPDRHQLEMAFRALDSVWWAVMAPRAPRQ